MNHSFIYNFFTNQDVFIIGSGGSLFGFDYSKLIGRKVVAVNHAYKFCEHDILLHYDRGFLQEAKFGYEIHNHKSYVLSGNNAGVAAFGRVGLFKRAFKITDRIEDGLFMADSISDGKQPIKPSSSVLPAINAALIGGARRIFLLGCDGRYLTQSEIQAAWILNGNKIADMPPQSKFMHHCSQDSVAHRRNSQDEEKLFKIAAQGFSVYKNYPVFNLSKFTIIDLPKAEIAEIL